MAKSGIDVSKWQGKIDWQKVKNAGIEFALLRAGYGDTLNYPSQIDATFEYNYSQCKRFGIPVGVYWYSYATTVEMAKQEARSCKALLKGKQLEYPVLYDVEEQRIFNTGKADEISQAFCFEMEADNFWVGIYIYRCAVQTFLSERTRTRFTMAIAEYGPKLNYSGPYGIWQNSSTFRVAGINGDVDHDWCYVDYPKLIKEKGKNGYPLPSPKEEFRVEAIQPLDLFFEKDGRPPIDYQYEVGRQCTIEKTMKIGNEIWGKVKGRNSWLNLSQVKKV